MKASEKKRTYTTGVSKRKDGTGSSVRVPVAWLDCSKRYDIIHDIATDGNSLEIVEGSHRKAWKDTIYANVVVEWEAGKLYQAWKEGNRVYCALIEGE